MAVLKTYNAGEVSLIVGTRQLKGLAEGTFVAVTRDEDTFTKQVGADGEVTRSKTNNKAGSIVFTLLQGSDANDYLSDLHATDENTSNGLVPVFIRDASGRTVIFSENSWLRKLADVEFGKESGEREWTIDCADLQMFVGGN